MGNAGSEQAGASANVNVSAARRGVASAITARAAVTGRTGMIRSGVVLRRAVLAGLVAWAGLGAGGCGSPQRTIVITSDPPGARVWLNDVDLGTTPVQTPFKFFGKYDVRLAKEGYEPLVTSAEAKAPLHETPGLDLGGVLLPGKPSTRVEWEFTLVALPPRETGPDGVPIRTPEQAAAESELVDRARSLREKTK